MNSKRRRSLPTEARRTSPQSLVSSRTSSVAWLRNALNHGWSHSLRRSSILLTLLAVPACNRTPRAVPAGNSAERASTVQTGVRWLLGPTPDADLLHADASEASLQTQFGARAVRAESVYTGEGFSEYGTILFPGDSTLRLAIVWEDTVRRARPAYVYVTGRKVTWRLYPGVGIGTDLKTLETLNGRAFDLAGFGWDYSGTTSSFQAGRLDSLWTRNGVLGNAVLLRLDPVRAAPQDSLTSQVLGDRTFSSAHRAMQALNPQVYQILVRPR